MTSKNPHLTEQDANISQRKPQIKRDQASKGEMFIDKHLAASSSARHSNWSMKIQEIV